MILVDSSVWIDHLRRPDAGVAALLADGRIVCHPFVIGELACGHLRERERVLTDLALLPRLSLASHGEAMYFVDANRLAGSGIGWADVHLLVSTKLAGDATLWSHDKRLATAAERLGVCHMQAGR